MSKLGGFFARKSGLYDKAEETTVTPLNASSAALPDNPLELDEELFSALGAKMGSENEQLRNLLIDVSAKMGELDHIKAAVSRLVDPVSKTLETIETEQAEKLSLQTVLNNTRTAYGKLRNEIGEIEKKAVASEQQCDALRRELTTTQTQLRTAEATKAEIATDMAARRAQISDLEGKLTRESSEARILRDENARLDEKLSASDKRIIVLESDLNTTRQKLLMAEDEKQAQQISFEKANAEASRLSRKLTETETTLNVTQGRLRSLEANFAEMNTDRTRLSRALDEANERYEHEHSTQRMRFETLQARASATEKLLIEAREHLVGRAEEMRNKDQRNMELVREREALQMRVQELEAERHTREALYQEVEQARNTFMERGASLARAFNSKEAALARAEESATTLTQRIEALEAALIEEKQKAEQTIEELNGSLRREKMQRSVVEGALDTGRKDVSRLMRELAALKREQPSAEDPTPLHAANAA
jgi:crescentin